MNVGLHGIEVVPPRTLRACYARDRFRFDNVVPVGQQRVDRRQTIGEGSALSLIVTAGIRTS
jgi:hypothetical protein